MLYTIITIGSFIAGLIFGAIVAGTKDKPQDRIVWRKKSVLDEHEKAIGE
jgi:hypothetical protein